MGEVGLSFVGMGIGIVIATVLNMTYFNQQYLRAAKRLGHKPPPEQHLIKAMWAAVIGPISLFAFAWTSQPSVHWAAAVCSSLPFGIAFTLAFTASFTYKVDAYRPYAASAMGANSFLRSSFAAAFPLFTVQMVRPETFAIATVRSDSSHLSRSTRSWASAGLVRSLPFYFSP